MKIIQFYVEGGGDTRLKAGGGHHDSRCELHNMLLVVSHTKNVSPEQ